MFGVFEPGEGPALRLDTDACAFEDHGRFLTRRCRDTDPTHEVVDPLGRVVAVCGPHAGAWSAQPVVRDGVDLVRERVA